MSEGKMSLTGRIIVVLAIVGCLYCAYYFLIRKGSLEDDGKNSGASSASSSSQPRGAVVEIGIAYGTEKRTWMEWAAQEFAKTPEGQKIKLNLLPKGSQEGAQAFIAGDK